MDKKVNTQLYLEESDILDIYHKYNGKGTKENAVSFANGIAEGDNSLESHFNDFCCQDQERTRNVFVLENDHWITVHLEKNNEGGITYQVADSLQGQGADTRSQNIDSILGCFAQKKLFKSTIQGNGYDCGIYAALNAVDMSHEKEKSDFTCFDANHIRNTLSCSRERENLDKIFASSTQVARHNSLIDSKQLKQGDINIDSNTIVQQQKELDYWKNLQQKTKNQSTQLQGKG